MPFERRGGMADRASLRAREALRRARAYRARGDRALWIGCIGAALCAGIAAILAGSEVCGVAAGAAALGAGMCIYWKR